MDNALNYKLGVLSKRDDPVLTTLPPFIGLCPQQSILYDMLTPREHLTMYGKLKGVLNSTELETDVKRYCTYIIYYYLKICVPILMEK